MGTSRWSPEDWDLYALRNSSKSCAEIFQRAMMPDLNPKEITFRESCDSELNPLSTPIIVAVDVTGSMGVLAEVLIRKGLGVLIEEIYDRKPVTDPHVMVMAVGDAWCDRAPLQVTQFEADITLAEQLSRFWIEGGGGGNRYESYNLPWYFAATRTKCDAIVKRHKKGYLFTVGDEPPPPNLLAKHIEDILGEKQARDLQTKDVLNMALKSWEVFHVMVEQGSYYKNNSDSTKKSWQALLGQRAIPLSDYEKLAEVIVSTIEMNEGADIDEVTKSWLGSTALVVRDSLSALSRRGHESGRSDRPGLTRF